MTGEAEGVDAGAETGAADTVVATNEQVKLVSVATAKSVCTVNCPGSIVTQDFLAGAQSELKVMVTGVVGVILSEGTEI